MKWDGTSTKLLITSVEVRPELWDVTLDEYSKKNITSAKWEEVAMEVYCTAKEAKDKWRNLRVYFNNLRRQILNKKSGQGLDELFTPNWPFYKDMSFVLPTVTAKPSVSNLMLQNCSSEDEMTNMTENDESMPEENTFSEDEVQTVLKEKQQQESASQPLPQDNLTTPGSSQSTKTPIRNRMTLSMRKKKRQESEESNKMIELMGTVTTVLQNKAPSTLDDHFVAQLACLLKEIPNSIAKERLKMRLMEMTIEFKYDSTV